MIVSILIPLRNEENSIKACLNSLLANDFSKSQYEVILIDGMSQDKTIEIINDFKWEGLPYKVINNPHKIVPTALNLGIQQAAGDYIIRIDAHTSYAKDYITQCVKELEKTGAENVGGAMRVRFKNSIQKAIALATTSKFGIGNSDFHFKEKSGFVDSVYLGAFPKRTFKQFGLFDEELIRNQDDEFNYRIKLNGGKIYLSNKIKSYYYPRSSLNALFSQYFQYGYWKVRVIQKLKTITSLRHFIPAIFVTSLFLLFIFGIGYPPSIILFYSLLITYASCNLLISKSLTKHESTKTKIVLPFVFICLHFGYGIGFLIGIISFNYSKIYQKK